VETRKFSLPGTGDKESYDLPDCLELMWWYASAGGCWKKHSEKEHCTSKNSTKKEGSRSYASSIPERKPCSSLRGTSRSARSRTAPVNSSALFAADSQIVLPVSCIEQGRWSYRSRAFSSGSRSPHLSQAPQVTERAQLLEARSGPP
jgi:hypothetical protein